LRLGKTPADLAASLTVSEFAEFKALYNIDPWGDERSDFRHALNTAVLSAVFGGGSVDIEKYAFGPIHARARAASNRTPEEIEAANRAAFELLNSRLPIKDEP